MIKNKLEYDAALIRIQNLKRAEPGSPEGTVLDELITAVEYYEETNFEIPNLTLEDLKVGAHFYMINGMGCVDRLYINYFSSQEQKYYVTNITGNYSFDLSKSYFEAHQDHYFKTRQFAILSALRDLKEQQHLVQRKLTEIGHRIKSFHSELDDGDFE